MNDEDVHTYQQALVAQLKQAGYLTTQTVEEAFLKVPRHLFLPEEPLEKVYADRAIVFRRGAGGEWTSSSSQPAIMAVMLEQLDLKPGLRVLEIGTGTGFNAALIASIVGPGGKVVTVDIQPDLVAHARQCLDQAGYAWVQAEVGDGGYGYAEGAPYDRIILTVGSHVITPAWREQLAPGGGSSTVPARPCPAVRAGPGGRLVLPLDITSGLQHAVAFEKRGEALESVSVMNCGFMTLQGAFGAPPPLRTPIGPDPNLCLFSEHGRALPAGGDTIADWLSAPGQDRATGVTTSMPELWRSFFGWMGLQATRQNQQSGLGGSLRAMGDLADRDVIPALFGLGGEWSSMNSAVWIEPDGMAALMRPPGQRPPFIDLNCPADDLPFELYVRQLGPGIQTTQRMLDYVYEWDRAGRPASSQWHIRAIPAGTDYQPGEGEFLVDRAWTKLIIRYRSAAETGQT